MGTLWERSAHSANHMFSIILYVLCLFVILVISHLALRGNFGFDCSSSWSLPTFIVVLRLLNKFSIIDISN